MVVAKRTTKNQLTLPKAVRIRLAELGIRESDVADAVNWARHQRARVGVCVPSVEAELAAVLLATGSTHTGVV